MLGLNKKSEIKKTSRQKRIKYQGRQKWEYEEDAEEEEMLAMWKRKNPEKGGRIKTEGRQQRLI